jgi:hypothetical protein
MKETIGHLSSIHSMNISNYVNTDTLIWYREMAAKNGKVIRDYKSDL